MRIRLSPKGEIVTSIKQIFNDISNEEFFKAKGSVRLLQASITQFYISRNMDMDIINRRLNGLQLYLNAGCGNVGFKQQVIYKRLQELIGILNTGDGKKPSNKYDHLMQIYVDLQDDVGQFARTKRYEDAETIRGDFADIRGLEDQFSTDKAEYKLYQDIVKQIGLCNGALIRISFETSDSADIKKIYATFENLYPKIESLVASKKFREEKKGEEELSDVDIKQIKDLHEHQEMNAEQIAEYTGLSQDIVESVLFGDVDSEN